VSTAVYLVGRWAKRDGIDPDIVYNVAVFGILGGIIGARFTHVADNLDYYSDNLGQALSIWEGGIGLWGGILGGWIGATAYAYITKAPIGALMDLSAPALLIAQTIGRVGDIINGEHWSKATELPWGWVFTHTSSPGFRGPPASTGVAWDPTQATHPTIVYEMMTNTLIFFVIWRLQGRFRPAGALWMLYISLYSAARFGLQFFRLDDVKFWEIQEAHIIAILVLLFTVPWMLKYMRWGKKETPPPTAPTAGRSGRRRRRASA
jgi:phosphatidylglycerol:prolipoprotein diacylglycerol transferase